MFRNGKTLSIRRESHTTDTFKTRAAAIRSEQQNDDSEQGRSK
jgi:hypothetical protein